MLEVLEINAEDGMEALRDEWEDLAGRSRNAGIFQTWEWVSCCRYRFGRGKRLVIFTVRQNGRLVGLAPMEVSRIYALPLRRLQFIGSGVSDYMDFIVDKDHEEAVLQALFGRLSCSARWDLVDLQQLPEGSPTLGIYPRLQRPRGWLSHILEQENCPYLPLDDSWEKVRLSLGKKMRWNLGYYERLMRRNFDLQISALEKDELDEGMKSFFRLHAKRWKKRFLPGVLADSRKQAFHTEMAWLAYKRGWLRLYGLRLDGKLKSVLYCFMHRKKSYYYLGGFEPDLSKYSLGTVLTGYAVRDAVEHGCLEFDFLRGNERYKYRWTGMERMNHRIILRQDSLRSGIAARIGRLEHMVEQRFKAEMHKHIGAG